MARSTTTAAQNKAAKDEALIRREAVQLLSDVEDVDLSDTSSESAAEISDKFVFEEDFSTAEELRDLIVQEIALSDEKVEDSTDEVENTESDEIENTESDEVENTESDDVDTLPSDPTPTDVQGDYLVQMSLPGMMIGAKVRAQGEVVSVPEDVYNLSDEDQRSLFGKVFFEKI